MLFRSTERWKRFIRCHGTIDAAVSIVRRRDESAQSIEEGTIVNGFGAYMTAVVAAIDTGVRVAIHGVPDRIIEQAPRARQLALVGLDAAGIANRVRALHETEAIAG